jgi:hypothetical protein
MALFVHLAAEKNIPGIRRSGIRLRRPAKGVYAMPVTPNFFVSHQWLRELKRGGQRVILGVYFRIPDGERVWVGRYNEPHREMTAAQAAGLVMKGAEPEGYEVIIGRAIEKSEIHRIRKLSQVLGWRYDPKAHGKPPCGCPYCQTGLYGARKIREAYEGR